MRPLRVLVGPARAVRYCRDRIDTVVARVLLSLWGVQCGRHARFIGVPIVTRARDSSLRLGDRVLICSAARGNALGLNHRAVLRTWLPGAVLTIGDDVGISGASICAAVKIDIGSGTLIGANAVIVDTDFHPTLGAHRRYAAQPPAEPKDRVVIGANVFVGAGAVILKGSTIGDDATIGAGAVVSGSVPPGALAVGNPARVISAEERSESRP